jgi:hypothetical protein
VNVDRVAFDVHRVLAAAQLPHGFGGALALNFYADPRATLDVDVNVFAPWESRTDVIPLLEPLGYLPAVPVDRATPVVGVRLNRNGSRISVDAFFTLDPAYEQIRERLCWYPFGPEGELLPFLSAEDIALFKLSFNRDKDWVDLRRMLQDGPPLDLDYVERTVVALRGPTMYPRVARLRAMTAAGGELR